MAAAVANHHSLTVPFPNTNPNPFKICFSYAAYAKNLIYYLRQSNIPVEFGLSDREFATIEESFGFTFPPDLRSILQEGLPVGPGFPNWRSSSKQQLEILTNLPLLGICKEVSRNEFWIDDWGPKPADADRAAKLAAAFLKKSSPLIPVYRNFYIPAAPCTAGNPVFHVSRGDVRVWSFDIAGFFQKVEFRPRTFDFVTVPAWAATEARQIELWTEIAEGRGRRRWWSGVMDGCLEEVWWRLRDGGWTEEDVREMMMMDDCDASSGLNGRDEEETSCNDEGRWRVRVLEVSAGKLLRGGWPAVEVAELMGVFPLGDGGDGDGEFCFEFLYGDDLEVEM